MAVAEMMVREDAAFWIVLSEAPGIGPARFRMLCERFGGVEGVFAAGRTKLEGVRGLRSDAVDLLSRPAVALCAARKLAAKLDAEGVCLVTHLDADYPASLFDLSDPPPLLYVRGELPGPGEKTFSVSGSKRPSAKGAAIAHAAGGEMAQAGWTVVSGYATGVDGAAHLGALEHGGRTVLCLPMGIRAFALRPEFEPFRGEIGRRMVLVSERPADEGWASRAAVLRDRIIAAMGRAILVVEAGVTGGTMITFYDARRLGRPVYVVKYRHAPPSAEGNKYVVRLGGMPVESMSSFRAVLRAARLPRRAPPREKQTVLF